METAKPILLICGCHKYEEYLRAAIKRMTRPEWTVIGIIGGGTSSQFNEESRILVLSCEDTYETLPAKIHAACQWIHTNHPGIPGIFKTDDDMLFDMAALADAVSKNKAIPYWGIMKGMCKQAPVNPARIAARFVDTSLTPIHQTAIYCYGWGYWLSAGVLPHIVAATSVYESSPLEDVCTGYVLNRVNIFPEKINIPYREVPRCPELLTIQ
jgi:hypothetical protein